VYVNRHKTGETDLVRLAGAEGADLSFFSVIVRTDLNFHAKTRCEKNFNYVIEGHVCFHSTIVRKVLKWSLPKMKKAFRFGSKLRLKLKDPECQDAELLQSYSESPAESRFRPLGPPPEAPPPPPTYHFAMKEYNQTLAPLTSNDDGRAFIPVITGECNSNNTNSEESDQMYDDTLFPAHHNFPRQRHIQTPVLEDRPEFEVIKATSSTPKPVPDELENVSIIYQNSAITPRSTPGDACTVHSSVSFAETATSPTDTDCYYFDGGDGIYQQKQQWAPMNEPNMPDATYEEFYGDAYCGGPIKYIYPNGYHGLRPRSGPWKLSLLVFIIFMWLSIFIVGYCADLVDIAIYQNQSNTDAALDDDVYVIETRWCGSRFLYFMWAVSISITGLAAAYCSIIGYVQVRDFVVANSRSQPPGIMGKSDYYVKIDELRKMPTRSIGKERSDRKLPSYQYDRTIYQADGTPQFWGGHIYRPTQAAVAVTSR